VSGVPLSGTHAFTLWQGRKETTDIELHGVARLPLDAFRHPSNGCSFLPALFTSAIRPRPYTASSIITSVTILPCGRKAGASIDW